MIGDLKPALFHDASGNLFIQVGFEDATVTKKVPYFDTPTQFYDWLDVEVPKMCVGVRKVKADRDKKSRRKTRNVESEKRRGHIKRNHLRAVE